MLYCYKPKYFKICQFLSAKEENTPRVWPWKGNPLTPSHPSAFPGECPQWPCPCSLRTFLLRGKQTLPKVLPREPWASWSFMGLVLPVGNTSLKRRAPARRVLESKAGGWREGGGQTTWRSWGRDTSEDPLTFTRGHKFFRINSNIKRYFHCFLKFILLPPSSVMIMFCSQLSFLSLVPLHTLLIQKIKVEV